MTRDENLDGDLRYDRALSEWEERASKDWRDQGKNQENHAAPGILPDSAELVRLANARMPYGKYAGRYLIDLPEAYLVWFARNGYPAGDTGRLLKSLYVIKENGMEPFLRPLVREESNR